MGVRLRQVLCLFILFCLQCNGQKVSGRGSKKVDKNADMPLMKTHFPLKEGDNVYFWRLQKVGSSTLLSILMSYSYRYNFLPRRKGSSNAQCRRIAQCAIDNPHQNRLFRNETSKLKKYVEAKTPGSVKTVSPLTQTVISTEAMTASIPFKISLGHELCNLDEKYIRNNLACSFTNPEWSNKFKQGGPVKEIFMVRDPLSRSISVYYFWGELFKMAKINKEIQEANTMKDLSEKPGAENVKRFGGRLATTTVDDDRVTVKSGKTDKSEKSDKRDKSSRSNSGSNSKNDREGDSIDKASSDHVVISVKGKLAETAHNTNRDGGSGNNKRDGRQSSKRKYIRQFGRLLGEEDPEVLEEVERLLNQLEKDEEQREEEEEVEEQEEDYYHSAAYLNQLSTTATAAEEEGAVGLRFPFKRSSRQLYSTANNDSESVLDRPKPKLGTSTSYNKTIDGKMFMYHGDESSVPPVELAMSYASSLPFFPGMPGPSLSYSAFSNSLQDTLDIVKSDRMITIVVERLDESLVVASHFLGWSLADMVVTKHRKALSSHPKSSEWPRAAVRAITNKLNSMGEYSIYNASKAKLDQRIKDLKVKGIDVQAEVKTLGALQKRVTNICLDDTYLLNYREDLKTRGYPPHASENKLRDVEEKYLENGHIFSFNREILCSFDVCGSCEAHALLYNIGKGGMSEGKTIEEAATLSAIPVESIEGNVNFKKCPKKFTHPLPTTTA